MRSGVQIPLVPSLTKNDLWFIPIRVASNKAEIVVKTKDSEQAKERVKKLPEYWKNLNKLSFKKQKESRLTAIFLENEFCEAHNFKQIRFAEKIVACKHRYEPEKFNEYFCMGINKRGVSDNRCIIHTTHFKFDLPKDCPYLEKKSEYIQFQE